MNNKLIQTNGLWYRIKHFFKSIFFRVKLNKISEEEKECNSFANNYTLSEKFEQENKKKKLAEKLLLGELGTSELTESEVDEMTEYFIKDIHDIDNELARIKKHIVNMQQELKNGNWGRFSFPIKNSIEKLKKMK